MTTSLLTIGELPDDIKAIGIGYNEGMLCAQKLKVGSIFLGAMPEAEKLFPKDTLEYKGFIIGYTSHLPKNILCSWEDHVITAIHDGRVITAAHTLIG